MVVQGGMTRVETSQAETIWLWGDLMTVKASGADTGGAYSALEYTARPSSGSPLHIHHNEDEAFYILEGALTFQMDNRTFRAGVGSYVLIPRGTLHAFANVEDTPCRSLVILSPAGLEGYFMELGKLAATYPEGPPDPAPLQALAEKYNLEFLGQS